MISRRMAYGAASWRASQIAAAVAAAPLEPFGMVVGDVRDLV